MSFGPAQSPAPPGGALDGLIAQAQRYEALGFATMSMANIFGLDAIGALTVVGRESEAIELMTGVVPTYPRHPIAMAQQALTASAASGGRFSLGIGLSHKIVIEDMLGMSFDKPALVVPRTTPRLEQFIRASRAQDLGLVRMLRDDGVRDPRTMATALRTFTQQAPPSGVVVPGLLDGRANVIKLTQQWLERGAAGLSVAGDAPPIAAQQGGD